jgi:ankyrin repeat protein
MRGWIKAGLALALVSGSLAAHAQSSGQGSDGEAFLKAVEEGDAATAMPLADVPGTSVINYRGYKGDTALHIATRKREADWVGFLLNRRADANIGDAQGDTALIIASRIGFDTGVDFMLRKGARPDVANRRGETALIVAVQQRRPRIVELLLKAGANPDKADFAAGYTARDYAKRDSRNPAMLKLIESVKSTKKQVSGPSLN